YIAARTARERAVRGQEGYNKARFDDFTSSFDRAAYLKQYSNDLGAPARIFGLSDQMNLAVQGIATGLCHAVEVDNGVWDTHSNNDSQSGYHETLFATLLALGDQLSSTAGSTSGSKLIDETVVVAVSEMGRTPKLNADKGKDHWPVTSAMVFGA